ncbi:alpha/beta hydrolase family protein [Lutibacter flavus]|uniref:Alpha/beta hydrolase family protein n=1 Tax=Lutibacter flavus TaxID=691689 RepID=A0A238WXS1_9FLAO|nr:alpha/beta hydrolase fold domain-containing protein [Lutibacter flavus]SNR51316.1 Alpha/beta hydrolase family protein [Lutibacter flavus]
MNRLTNLIVKSSHHNKPILTDVFYKKNKTKKPIVIFCHGYKGYKDWGAWNLATKEFANKDIFFVKFNFSHNGGTVKNPIDFPDLEAFGQNNFITELNDLEDVIDWILNNSEFKNEIDAKNITLIGHSRGGGIVSIKASENNKISKVISWSGVSDYGARFPKGEQLEQWKKAGVSFITNARTKQQMPHYFQFYTSFIENEERLTIKNAVSNLKIPHLIVHGTDDTVVLPSEAKNIHSWNPASKLLLIDQMNHPLGCTQPWKESDMPIHLKAVVKHSVDFILNN